VSGGGQALGSEPHYLEAGRLKRKYHAAKLPTKRIVIKPVSNGMADTSPDPLAVNGARFQRGLTPGTPRFIKI